VVILRCLATDLIPVQRRIDGSVAKDFFVRKRADIRLFLVRCRQPLG